MSLAARLAVVSALVLVAAPPAHAGNGATLLKLMPEDASMFVVADVAAARSAPLFQKTLKTVTDANPDMVAKLTAAGVDLATAFDTVALGAVGDLNHLDKDSMIIVAEGPAVSRVVKAIVADKTTVVHKFHGITYWTGGTEDYALAVVQRRLLLTRTPQVEHAIDLALGKAKSAARSPRAAGLRAAVAATDTRHALWAAVVMPADASRQLAPMGVTMQGLSMAATLTTGIDVELKIITASEQEATTAANLVSQQQQAMTQGLAGVGLGGAAQALVIDHSGPVLRLATSLTEQELHTVLALAGVGGTYGR